ncbi:WD40 repeat domain-containing protein [Streptomyces sp. NPDC086077]|uniref:WD40 repeat domain-containing protein n=1 Tax=Streptomyces sp. NPDC086077 TaxID=3154862 RepID=UPI00342E3AE8
MTSPENPGERRVDVVLRARATEHGTVYQSAQSMIVVQGDVNRHEHYYPAGERHDRTTSPASGGTCPYPGMRAFRLDEAQWFFGREEVVSQLLGRLRRCLHEHRPLAVVAPSGAGKSSLLRAGLLWELAKGQVEGSARWRQLLLTPTSDPLGALTAGLVQLTGAEEEVVAEAVEHRPQRLAAVLREGLRPAPGERLVLVVDQFEELFTACEDAAARHRFVAALAALADGGDAREPLALVVYGLRADHYGSCLAFPHLRDVLDTHQVIVGPMDDAEVRRAVTLPADRARLELEQGLVDLILRDLRGTAWRDGGAAYGAGQLPLLAHALERTWVGRRGRTLTVGSYRDTGGIDGAIERTAQDVFGGLTPAAQAAARPFFLGLVRIGENGEVSRRRRTRRDLLRTAADRGAVEELVERFADARLLTMGVAHSEATVEVTHEALLWAWTELRDWIKAAGQHALVRQDVEETAAAWENGGRGDATLLYRGPRLEQARTWAADHRHDVQPLAAAFLAASRRHDERARRIRRGAIATITTLALIASALAVFAFDRRSDALAQRDAAIFNRVTAEADRQRDTNSALAAQLDLVAYGMRATPALRTRLMQGAGTIHATPLPQRFERVYSISFGRAGRLATSSGALRVWDTSDPAAPAPLTGAITPGEGRTAGTAYNQRGDLLAVGDGGDLRMYDVSDARHPVALSPAVRVSSGPVWSVAFGPDGRTLAVSTYFQTGDVTTGTVELWNVAEPRQPRRLSTVHSVVGQVVVSTAFSPDGDTLAVSGGTAPGTSRSRLLRLWDVSDPARPKALGGELGGHNNIVNRVVYSPDGRTLVSAGSDNRAIVWDVSKPRRPKVANTLFLNSPVMSLAFSPDGRILATGENSGAVHLWNAGSPGATRVLASPLRGHTTTVNNLAFDVTGRTLASSGIDGRVLLWRLPGTLAVTGAGSGVESMAVSSDGRLLAAASGNRVTLWDVSEPTRLTSLGTLPSFPSAVNALAFRPGRARGPLLATGEVGGDVRLWDVSAPARPSPVAGALPGQTKPVGALAFDAGGRSLMAASQIISGGFGGGLRIWDVSDPGRPDPLGDGELRGQQMPVRGMAAAPRGGYVYTADTTGVLRVWRTADGAVPSLTGESSSSQFVFALAASPRASLVATGGGDSKVRLWDVSRPRSPTAVGEPLLTGGITNSVGFSPDGTLLASGNAIGQVRLWDVSDPARAGAYGYPVSGHGGSVSALAHAPRGGHLVTGGGDGTLRVWQTDTARARSMLCAATRHALTAARWREYVSPDLPYEPPCGG